MIVKIKKVPASGDSVHENVEIPATGTTVAEALRAAGIDPGTMKVTIDNKPVDDDTHVPAGATITLTEKAKGS